MLVVYLHEWSLARREMVAVVVVAVVVVADSGVGASRQRLVEVVVTLAFVVHTRLADSNMVVVQLSVERDCTCCCCCTWLVVRLGSPVTACACLRKLHLQQTALVGLVAVGPLERVAWKGLLLAAVVVIQELVSAKMSTSSS